MNTAVAIFLFIHGFAHVVGFLVYWRILKDKDVEYKTTIFPGDINVGDVGIRFIGLIYLLIAIALGYLGYDLLTDAIVFQEYIWPITVMSTVLTVFGWPDTKFGLLANGILIAFLWLNSQFGWLTYALA
jgi:hypothetical protein